MNYEKVFESIPNLASTGKILLKSIQKKSSEKFDLDFNLANILISSLKVEQITQRINLPLLRFINQFTSIYQDVLQTRFVMRKNRDYSCQYQFKLKDCHPLSSSKSSSSSTLSLSTDSNSETLISPEFKDDFVINIEEENPYKENLSESKQPEEFIDPSVRNCWQTAQTLFEQYNRNQLKSIVTNDQMIYHNASEMNTRIKFDRINEDNFYSAFSYVFNRPFIVVGNSSVKKMNFIAMLSGLRLESELKNFDLTLNHQEIYRQNRFEPNSIGIKIIKTSSIDFNLGSNRKCIWIVNLLLFFSIF